MVELHVVGDSNSHLYSVELEQYFRGRYEVYVRERGWKELDRPDGREIDQFDTKEAVHLLAIEHKQVVGGHRFNPSLGPTLLSEVFPWLSATPLERSPDVFETTRLWVAKEKRGRYAHPSVESILLAGTMEFALALKLRKIRVLFETWWVSRFQSLGWQLRPLGLPQDINGLNCIAVAKDVTEAIWMEICLKRSVSGSVLFWKGTARPSYQLPELIPAVA